GMFMKSLAQELAPHRIRVNSIAPGAITTPINRAAWETPEARASLLTLIPYGRIGTPEDIGRAVAWLASDDAVLHPRPDHQRGRQHQVLRCRALPLAPGRLRRAQALGWRLAGLAHLLRGPGAVLRVGRAPLPGARGARRRPDRSAGGAVPASAGEPRAPHPAA